VLPNVILAVPGQYGGHLALNPQQAAAAAAVAGFQNRTAVQVGHGHGGFGVAGGGGGGGTAGSKVLLVNNLCEGVSANDADYNI
jgi:hypothetical protein